MCGMENEVLHRQFTDHQFSCYRSSRYWAAREIFWRFIDHLCKLLIFVTSAGAVCIKAIGGDPAAIGWIAAAALSAYILESFAVQGKITFASRQCQRYVTVLMLFPIEEGEETPALLKRIRNERLMVEKDETILLECLDVFCHNKECVAEGRPEDAIPLTWFQRWIGCYLPFSFKRST